MIRGTKILLIVSRHPVCITCIGRCASNCVHPTSNQGGGDMSYVKEKPVLTYKSTFPIPTTLPVYRSCSCVSIKRPCLSDNRFSIRVGAAWDLRREQLTIGHSPLEGKSLIDSYVIVVSANPPIYWVFFRYW